MSLLTLSCLSPGDHRLSLLLSQATGSQYCRDLLALQLADWSRMQTDSYLPEERLRIFTLLAGKPVRDLNLFPVLRKRNAQTSNNCCRICLMLELRPINNCTNFQMTIILIV